MPNHIPSADALISNYPQGDAATVKRQIGGGVNADWITNTCAIRLSRSFNKAGAKIPGNVAYLNTVRGGDGDRYAFRVKEFRKWLEARYGPPTLKAKGTRSAAAPESFRGKKGIICFVDCGWTDASGHLDLWDGEKCVNHGYFELAKEILLWESNPRPEQSARPAATAQGGQRTGTVTATTLNVRSAPSTAGDIVGQVHRGEVVPILESRSGWYRIGADAWVSTSYIRIEPPAA